MIHVAIKSFNRWDAVETLKSFPEATVWVPESQAASYRKTCPRVEAIPDELDGNLSRKSNAILDRTPEEKTLILDDDISSIRFFERGKSHVMVPDQISCMVAHGFDIAEQLGVSLWGINQNSDEMAYCTFRPFNLLCPILGPFNGHISPTVRYDETVLGKDDYDFWLQTIQREHRTFRMNKYHYMHDHGKREGGFVAMRTKQVERDGITRMLEKWGPKVFKVGGSPGARRDRVVNEEGNILNSRVSVPIAGV